MSERRAVEPAEADRRALEVAADPAAELVQLGPRADRARWRAPASPGPTPGRAASRRARARCRGPATARRPAPARPAARRRPPARSRAAHGGAARARPSAPGKRSAQAGSTAASAASAPGGAAADAGSVEQPAASEREHAAPGSTRSPSTARAAATGVALEPEQREHLLQQPALADARLALEQQQRRPAGAGRARRRLRAGGPAPRCGPPSGGRTMAAPRRRRRRGLGAPALAANPFGQRPGLRPGVASDLGQPRAEALEQLERAGAVAYQRQRAERGAERAGSDERLERQARERRLAASSAARPSGPARRPSGSAPRYRGGARAHARRRASPRRASRVGHAETLEELADHELRRRRPVLGGGELLQPVHVELHRAGRESDLPDRYVERRPGPRAGGCTRSASLSEWRAAASVRSAQRRPMRCSRLRVSGGSGRGRPAARDASARAARAARARRRR